MPSILTLTMNPALDLLTTVPQVMDSHKLRCSALQTHPGGGGINVARILRRMGNDVLALFPAGGETGAQLQQLLLQEDVAHEAVPIQGRTRESFSVHELATQHDFRFVLPGPELSASEVAACRQSLLAHAQPGSYWVLSGSLPPGTPDNFYAEVARQAQALHCQVILDASGPPLKAALAQGVTLFKPSLRELRDLTGLPLTTEPEWIAAAQQLLTQGQARLVALSLGEQGAVLVSAQAVWRAQALPVPVRSTIGAGDSFVGGLVHALNQHAASGLDNPHVLVEAFRWAMATSAAALLSLGTALAQPEDIQRLLPQVLIQRWAA